tara:strand:- start:1 stop:273 length:273 start_codon:yes stop_codon:yes gene_type:complete
MGLVRTTLIIIATLLAGIGSAQIKTGHLQSKHIVETRVKGILKGYDPRAIVVVNITPEQVDVGELPSVPFVVDGFKVPGKDGQTRIKGAF